MKPAPPKEKIVKGKKVPVKPPPSPKPKMRKGQGMQIQIGPFVVCPCQGVVQPNTTQNISVEITHNVVEKLESIAIELDKDLTLEYVSSDSELMEQVRTEQFFWNQIKDGLMYLVLCCTHNTLRFIHHQIDKRFI